VNDELKISAIVPATDEAPTLGRCVDAIRSGKRPPDELLVITEPYGSGPAAARNEGARRADGEVLVFVDADVVVHPDALARIEAAFAAEPRLTAIFGSYDDSPEAPGAVSAFRNLLHHQVHSSAPGPAETFWAGLGAIRREEFLAAGGFDAGRYPLPAVEDIELGARLAREGARIVLDPEIRGTHLKRWTLREMIRTDFLRRGVPWTELLLDRGPAPGSRGSTNALNLGWRHRVSAVASLAAAAELLRRRPLGASVALAVMVCVNRELYSLVLRRRGPAAAAAAVALHAVHHLTSAAALVAGLARTAAARQNSHQRS
jgi:GT2 family glycosyltransferase